MLQKKIGIFKNSLQKFNSKNVPFRLYWNSNILGFMVYALL